MPPSFFPAIYEILFPAQQTFSYFLTNMMWQKYERCSWLMVVFRRDDNTFLNISWCRGKGRSSGRVTQEKEDCCHHTCISTPHRGGSKPCCILSTQHGHYRYKVTNTCTSPLHLSSSPPSSPLVPPASALARLHRKTNLPDFLSVW